MANPKIQEALKLLKEFFATVEAGNEKTQAALNEMNTALDRISAGKFAGSLEKIVVNFQELATNAKATTSDIQAASQALEKLATTSNRIKVPFVQGRTSLGAQMQQQDALGGLRGATAVAIRQNPHAAAVWEERDRIAQQAKMQEEADLHKSQAFYAKRQKMFESMVQTPDALKEAETIWQGIAAANRKVLDDNKKYAAQLETIHNKRLAMEEKAAQEAWDAEMASRNTGGSKGIGQKQADNDYRIMSYIGNTQRAVGLEEADKRATAELEKIADRYAANAEFALQGEKLEAERVKILSKTISKMQLGYAQLAAGYKPATLGGGINVATGAGGGAPVPAPPKNAFDYLTGTLYPKQAVSTNIQKLLESRGMNIDLAKEATGEGDSGTKLKVNRDAMSGLTRLEFSRQIGEGKDAVERLNMTLDKNGNILRSTQRQYRTWGDAIVRDTSEVLKWTIAVSLIYAPMRKASEMFQEMIENQSKLADVQIATGGTTKQMADTFKSLAEVASATGEHVVGAVEAFRQAYQATGGIADYNTRAATATKLLTDALTLSKLAGIDEAGAIDLLAGLLNQMGLKLTQGTSLMDKWVAVAKVANVDINTLATTFVTTSTAAEGVGLSVDKLNAVIAATASVTAKSATETANMVRAFISGFQSDQSSAALEKFGIATKDAQGNARDFLTVLRDVRAASDKGIISQSQLTDLANTFGGGARRGAQVSAFLKDLDRVSLIENVSATAKSGTAYEALGVKMQTVQVASQQLANSFTVLAQTLGGEGGILGAGAQVIQMFTHIIDSLTELTHLVGRATPLIVALGAAGLYLSKNPGTQANLLTGLTGMAGRVGGRIGGVVSGIGEMADPTMQSRMALAMGRDVPDRFSDKLIKAGDTMGQRFSNWVEAHAGTMFAGAEIVISSAADIMGGKVAKGIMGGLGGLAGGLLGSWNPIFMILGQVLASAFYEKFIGYSVDMGSSLAKASS
jgi:TP901 family phage tail tape measure protein